MTEEDNAYLKALADSEFQAIDEYDNKIFALAGGAFGVSFAFLKDIVTPGNVTHKNFLIMAWACWCITLAFNLTSFYFSHLAMRGAQRKYRAGERDEKKLSGFTGNAVIYLNPITGGFFILGLICMSVFVTSNLYGTTTPTTNAATVTATTNAVTTNAATVMATTNAVTTKR